MIKYWEQGQIYNPIFMNNDAEFNDHIPFLYNAFLVINFI
ncbi:hypothetical protein yinte0001_11780 [Yersinia intermedia ATCC 29909]|nr:hypothetical protein yinte0001_11780 [Yersinia intermedia ATCC 29909]